FSWIALGESTNGASRLLVAALRRRTARAEIGEWIDAGSDGRPCAPFAPAPSTLAHSALQRRAPDGRPIGTPIALSLKAGHPTILVGESGSGKTSLLKQIAGWIGDDVMVGDTGPLPAEARRAATMFCPHDAAILADTVRANLFAPGRADAELWEALAAVELDERIGQAGGLDGWIVQDMLSLGEAQRINLARAWLSDRPVVALDEPTEHLGDDQGRRILQRLLHRLSDRIVVLSSHRLGSLPDATTIEL
ncbi:MAG TPA: ATP-binding cassette domain-containing protein, partial [Rhizobiaceae bacterium]